MPSSQYISLSLIFVIHESGKLQVLISKSFNVVNFQIENANICHQST